MYILCTSIHLCTRWNQLNLPYPNHNYILVGDNEEWSKEYCLLHSTSSHLKSDMKLKEAMTMEKWTPPLKIVTI